MLDKDAQQAEWRRGTLPPGKLGWRRAVALRDQTAELAAEQSRAEKAAAEFERMKTASSGAQQQSKL